MKSCGTDKVCNIQDPEKLRETLQSGRDVSCAICCATAKDPANLCEPVKRPNVNLFCE